VFDPNQFKETVMESIKSLVDANVVIGQPIVSGGITIIPVFKASIGLISGGASPAETPLGGGGAGVSVTPVTFIVIEKDSVRILSAGDSSPLERLVDAAPALIDKLSDILGACCDSAQN
jgi:sporulation protein YtfJ